MVNFDKIVIIKIIKKNFYFFVLLYLNKYYYYKYFKINNILHYILILNYKIIKIDKQF